MGDAPADGPTLTSFWPADTVATGTAVVVCPGGGYAMLAATTATLHDELAPPAPADATDRAFARPNLLVLGYPVITFLGDAVHARSRAMLLDDRGTPELDTLLSAHLQVDAETPPTFLFHTSEDAAVPAENSVLFYRALRAAGVPAELHVYERGRHGVRFAPGHPVLRAWPDRLAAWLRVHQPLAPAP